MNKWLIILAAVGAAVFLGMKTAGAAIFEGPFIGDSEGNDMTPEQQTANLTAFLALVREVEAGGDYTALVMGGQLTDFADHPANLGWPGVRLTDGRLTTAAGAYQITRTTWNDLGGVSRYGSFDPDAQDQAAVDLIQRRGAMSAVKAGQFDTALAKLRNEWEAFARMLDGDYPTTLADARAIYQNSGGEIT